MRKTLLRRAAALTATLGLTSMGLLGADATPAQAATSDCPSGYFCGWANGDGTGSMFKTNASKATLGTWDNKIRMLFNRTGLIACLYDKPNYGTQEGYGWAHPDPYPTVFGGTPEVSSIKLVRTLRECEAEAYPGWWATPSPNAIGFGDMNADRRADIILRDEAGRLWFLPGDDTGRLIGTGGWNSMGQLAAFGDLSGDGRSDLFAVEKATGKLWLYPGTGSGGLGARKLIGTGGWNDMNALIGAGDMNSDGRADLVAREKATGKLWLYPATTSRALGARKLIGTGGWNSMQPILAVGDTSGDGRPDLEASDNYLLWQYQGLATGGLRKADWQGGWWALEGATAF
jgi:hypothetical protein